MQKALIAGASGLVGSECLNLLLNDDNFHEVVAIVRNPLPISHPKLKQAVIDYDNLENYKEQLIADVVFCCLGTTMRTADSQEKFKKVDFQYPVNLAKISHQNGTKKFILISALGANPSSAIFYNRVKGETEFAISKMKFDSFCFLRPSLLLGKRKEFRGGERAAIIFFKLFSKLFFGPLARYKGIEVSKVAQAMLAVSKASLTGKTVIESEEIFRIATGQKQLN